MLLSVINVPRKLFAFSYRYISLSARMTDSVANYEATVTTGLESIAKDEVKEKLNAEARTQQGRVWFASDEPVSKILKLKSICNLFVIIYDIKLDESELPASGDLLEPLLMRVGDKCDWKTGLEKWKQMSAFGCEMDKILTKNQELKLEQPKFRVSCNRYGPKHNFTSPEVCSVFGHVVDTMFGWPIKMKDYDLEIMANFSENHLYVGLTLTPVALDRRNIVSLGFTTLRAATCYALLRVAKIQCGDIVIDPMAGSGAIPVECCSAWQDEWAAFTIAGELKPSPLTKCKANLEMFKAKTPNDIMQLDVTSLPFRENTIDVFVSDLPFGRRHGSKKINMTLYPKLLRDMARVARLNSGRAVLLTQDFKSINFAYEKSRDLWFQKMCSFVKIGNLNCYIYLFLRNDTVYSANK